MKSKTKPTRSKFSVLKQVCKLIPEGLVPKLARDYGIEGQSRTFSPWSHVVSIIYGQLSHSLGLNDVCDGLKNHSGKLSTIRCATAPSKNGLSHANRIRDAQMAEKLFWDVLKHFENICQSFGKKGCKAMPKRFKRTIHAVDASTIRLVANSIDWARHRRRKAAAKLHLRLNLQCFLPKFAIVDTAAHNDSKRARELCADIKAGEIVVFDKAYVDYDHLYDLEQRGIAWITRAKEDMSFIVIEDLLKEPKLKIISDQAILLDTKASNEKYPKSYGALRLGLKRKQSVDKWYS